MFGTLSKYIIRPSEFWKNMQQYVCQWSFAKSKTTCYYESWYQHSLAGILKLRKCKYSKYYIYVFTLLFTAIFISFNVNI